MLRRIKLRSSILRQYGEDILDVVKQAKTSPPDLPEPPNRREPDPLERQREQAMKAWRRKRI